MTEGTCKVLYLIQDASCVCAIYWSLSSGQIFRFPPVQGDIADSSKAAVKQLSPQMRQQDGLHTAFGDVACFDVRLCPCSHT